MGITREDKGTEKTAVAEPRAALPAVDPLRLLAALAVLVVAAYANHFSNGFHFDDTPTVVANPAIRSLSNIPRFFADGRLFSALPAGQMWRPVVSATLAVDYWIGGGLKPFWFHLSTLLWYLVELAVMFFLFRRIMDLARPDPSNAWTALFATAVYGVHPVNAETVNYIVQRGDLFNALGVAAALLWFIAYPGQRKYGLYLLPAVAATMAKAPALIFPFIFLGYIYLFEADRRWRPALRAALPAFGAGLAMAVLTLALTPRTFDPGAAAGGLYRLSQPWVTLRYFRCFFLPVDLTADTDWTIVAGAFTGKALAGYLFVAALIAAAVYAARRRETRPVAFGLAWFLLALIPTAVIPLGEVTNDHRMFFPFVGLALAVFWALRLLLADRAAVLAGIAGVAVLLGLIGTWQRNAVWHTEESLWRDVTEKSPDNKRGQVNYGNLLAGRGDFTGAVPYIARAAAMGRQDPAIEVRLAVAYAGAGKDGDAESHFQKALSLAPNDWGPKYFYARWMHARGRLNEAETLLKSADLSTPAQRYLLMQVLCDEGKWPDLDLLLADTLRAAPKDEVARGYMTQAARQPRQGAAADAFVQAASQACDARRWAECLSNARQALNLRPDKAEACYTASRALSAIRRNADAVHWLRLALRIRPDYDDARRRLTEVVE
jgi:protein O-mannosyl-transferase